MNDQAIGPAMTPAEWADVVRYTAPGGNRMAAVGMLAAYLAGSEFLAVAAIALRLSGAGPTEEDVDRCRRAANDAEGNHDQSLEYADYERMNEWNALADRIAALLPPREVG